MTTTQELLPGTVVHCRGLRWEIVHSQSLGPQTMYRLRGLGGATLGREFDILHPLEGVRPERSEMRPEKAAPLANWLVYHQAFILEQALGPDALLAVQPGRLQLEPYQLVPVLRAIRSSRVRLLLADGVGLGKTVQAGLVLTELVARRLAHRILIVSPAGPLLEQWQTEMTERFGLRLEVIDRAKLEEVRRKSELGANPFDYISLGLTSIDFVKQESVLELLEKSTYDVIVIDEAHHCMDIGASGDREDSQRRRLAEVLARKCDSLLLLTATPHDGNDRSFASLCELLDPSLVDGKGTLRGNAYRDHVVRRLKKHIFSIDPMSGEKVPKFKEREVTPVAVEVDAERHAAFIDMQRALLELVAPELKRAFRSRAYSDVLAWIALLKRSVSTVVACSRTLQVVADRYQRFATDSTEKQELRRQRVKTLRDYERKLERFGSITAQEEEERSVLEAEDIAQQLAGLQREIRAGSTRLVRVSDVVAHLDEVIDLSNRAKESDPKLDAIVNAVREIRATEPRANVLIYTEYTDSQAAVVASLEKAKVGTVVRMRGEDDDGTRSKITARFRGEDGLVLVSTDSAAEGLNLHQRCHHLIHLELPFNPNRLEQRNGRIDRYGQQFIPRVRYLYLRGTFEERILLRLIAKYEKQRRLLTFVPNTLGITSSEAGQARLLKGLVDEEARLFKQPDTLFDLQRDDENDGTDEATRELLEEIDRSLGGFREAARTNTWLGDAGLSADEQVLREAGGAIKAGERAEKVDLARFVVDAVKLDGGSLRGSLDDSRFLLRLPQAWLAGLDDLPGFDSEERTVRLTTRLEVTEDDEKRVVGFLGRAHPLVRRALERVRSLSFGSTSQIEDVRVSAVAAEVTEPELLLTYVGRVTSDAGRALERIVAVRVKRSGETTFHASAGEWLVLTGEDTAIRTRDVWKEHFEAWSEAALRHANAAIREGFESMAGDFVSEWKALLEKELASQEQWLQKRVAEITNAAETRAMDEQRGLFGGDEVVASLLRKPWQLCEEPVEKLTAFHSDRRQPTQVRVEADGVLRLYKKRIGELNALAALREPEVVPIGMLMILPESALGA